MPKDNHDRTAARVSAVLDEAAAALEAVGTDDASGLAQEAWAFAKRYTRLLHKLRDERKLTPPDGRADALLWAKKARAKGATIDMIRAVWQKDFGLCLHRTTVSKLLKGTRPGT